tara:strand:- start:769 stop:1575 length:807 start_codon:yes stop_codon:yes gene_type:complete
VSSVAVLSDGLNTEGIGALAQYQLMCMGLANTYNNEYTFTPFKNLQHYQYFNVTQEEFGRDVNELFSFSKSPEPSASTEVMTASQVMTQGQIHLESIFPFLRQQELFLEDDKKYFNKEEINVAIHVRVYTKTDCDPSPVRECFNVVGLLDHKAYYANIISSLKRLYKDRKVTYHIYSQGSPDDFKFFFELDSNVLLHIEEYPTISVYHMANADVLVMANSSLSYIAHLYGKCFTIARDSFYHKLYETTSVRADSTGAFDTRKLLNYGK